MIFGRRSSEEAIVGRTDDMAVSIKGILRIVISDISNIHSKNSEISGYIQHYYIGSVKTGALRLVGHDAPVFIQRSDVVIFFDR